MKRGEIVLIRESGTPASKARPCVVIQHNASLDVAGKISVCPLTSELRGPAGGRPFVVPSERNGLERPSEVEFDWIYTHPRARVMRSLGTLDERTMEQLDRALRRWLDL